MPVARIYLRNSSDKQAKAATIRAQRPDCGAIAARLGLEAVEYVDEGISGAAPLEERPGLRQLLAALGQGDVVVAFALDRLSRSDDEIDRAAIYGTIRRAGARIETVVDGPVDRSTFAGRIVDSVRQEVAAEERRKISARTSAGKRTAAAAGRKPQGATPYGLCYDRATGWAIDEERAAVVRQAFTDIAAGKSCAEVAASLPGPAPRGAAWGARGVWQLVTRRTYLGEWAFGETIIRVPAIVDARAWHAAQAALEASGRRGLRRTQHVYLCDEGVGRCSCGGELRIKWGGRGCLTSYYVCGGGCGEGWRRTEQVDGEVWARIQAALLREDLVGAAAAGAASASADAGAAERQAGAFAAKLEQLLAHERAVLARHRRGLVSEQALEGELVEVARMRRVLEKSAADARQEAAQARAGAVELAGVQAAARAAARGMAKMEGEERRGWVRELRTVVEVGRAVRVRFRLVAGVSFAVGGCSSARTAGESDTTVGDGMPGGILVVA